MTRTPAMLVTLCLAIASSADFKEFTITRSERSESGDSYPIERVVIEAQRADGSRVQAQFEDGDPEPLASRHVWLFPEGIRVRVLDRLRAKTTLYMREDVPAARPPAPDPQCGLSRLSASVKPIYRGEAEVLGFRTVAIQTEVRMDEGESFLSTDWKAPDLDCRTLKLVEDRRDSTGQVTGRFEMHAVRVDVGPPDGKLFEIPLDYAENSPSQLHDAHLIKAGGSPRPMPASIRERLAREDRRYFENHRSAGVAK